MLPPPRTLPKLSRHPALVCEEALYDCRALRQFVGIDLGGEPVPDEATICKFRYLVKKHTLGDHLFHLVNQYPKENGLKESGLKVFRGKCDGCGK